MLLSAPDEVARTNAITSASRCDERVGQVRAHEAVGARDEAGAACVDEPKLGLQRVDLVRPARWLYLRAARMAG